MNIYGLLGQHSFWMVNKALAKIVGIESALYLADLVSKRQYFIQNRDISENDWFFNTQSNIELDTTLTPHQQRNCVLKLSESGFLETKRMGIPAKLYFKINDNKILKILTTGSENFEELDVKDFNDINNNKGTRLKNKNKVFMSPTLDEVKLYFDEKGYKEEAAIKAYEYYSAADWHDKDGKKVKNWKQKMIGVWFKPENKKVVVSNFRPFVP